MPNLSWGMPVIKSLRANTDGHLDVHLMVSDPDRWAEPMVRTLRRPHPPHTTSQSCPTLQLTPQGFDVAK